MKQAVVLLVLALGGLELGRAAAGSEAVFEVVYGTIALMALMIAGTFLWLYVERATPLALGMAWSWLGAGLFAGWWWVHALIGQPDWAMHPSAAFLVLGLNLVGALLHFAVIQRSFGVHGPKFLWPVGLAFGVSLVVYLAGP